MKTRKPPGHRTDYAAKRTNGHAPDDSAVIASSKPNGHRSLDRAVRMRMMYCASDMYEILREISVAVTPEALAVAQRHAGGMVFEIDTGQRCSATFEKPTKQQENAK